MKVIELRAENFKRISAVQIRPDSNVVVLSGKNAHGKSSCLDALWVALRGKSVAPPVPVRLGEEEAKIELDLGELKIKRRFRLKEDGELTTSVSVESNAVGKIASPQQVLDAIIGDLTFDPLAFTRMKAAEQFNLARSLVPGVDFGGLKAANDKDFAERTNQNRIARDARTQAGGIVLPAGAKPVRVDVTELTAQISEATETNRQTEARRTRRASAESQIADYNRQISELIAKREELQKQLDTAEPLPEPIDVDALMQRLNAAAEINKAVEAFERRDALEKQAEDAEAKSAALTKAIEARETQKRSAISAANMPVEGLSFGDDCVLLDGLPFEQASTAKQLRAAFGIATALNPKLRLFCIRDGSLLDEDAMAWVAAFAEQNDMQVWIERVDSSGAVGFVIEDGHLAGQAPPEKPKPAEAEEEIF